VTLAEKAADLLPYKSQAYAAVLCNATGWVWGRDAQLTKRLYQRYVKYGAPFHGPKILVRIARSRILARSRRR
jgi:hypothetical protein